MKTRVLLAAGAVSLLGARAFAAGDVLAVKDAAGQLILTGDALSNSVEVTQGAATGDLVVTGTNGTTVNGGGSASFGGVSGLRAEMGDGDDDLALTGIRLRKALHVNLAAGADALTMSNIRVRGRTGIKGGLGADRVVAANGSVFVGIVGLQTGDGDDVVQFRVATLQHFLRINTGVGDDSLLVEDCEFGRVAPLRVETGDGDDEVELNDNSFHDDVEIDMSGGEDHLVIDDNNFKKDLEASGGGGNDDDLSVRSGNTFKIRRPPHFRGFED
jgi:hypothetical protein